MGKLINCKECGQHKKHMSKGLCGRCYSRLWARKAFGHSPRIDRITDGIFICSKCEKIAKHEAHGLCRVCYTSQRTKNKRRDIAICITCKKNKHIRAAGMCSRCYQKGKDGPVVKCKKCHKEKEHHARDMCLQCYSRWSEKTKKNRVPYVKCEICNEKRIHHAKGLCSKCYRRIHKRSWSKPIVICQKCGDESEHMAKGLCTKCYYCENNGRKYNHIRNSRKNGVPATLTDDEWNDILKDAEYSCVYCGSKKKITQDHWIPLSRGGGYTAGNIVPACKSCNSKKNAMTGNEYIELIKREIEYGRRHKS